MASAAIAPPPGAGTPPPAAGAASSPTPTAPTPATPNPQVEQASRVVIQIVQGLRGLAQAFPSVAPDVQEINDIMRRMQMKLMQGGQAPEPAAPPQQ